VVRAQRLKPASGGTFTGATDHNAEAILEARVDAPLENLTCLTSIRDDLELGTRLTDLYLLCRIVSDPHKVVGISFMVGDMQGDCIFTSVYNTTMKAGLKVCTCSIVFMCRPLIIWQSAG
jgi:hypothetical protein